MYGAKKHVDSWRSTVDEVLKSKVDELKVLGYKGANEEEVWMCHYTTVWKKDKVLRLHQVIQDIFHLSGSTYMNYLTVHAHEESDLFAQIKALQSQEE